MRRPGAAAWSEEAYRGHALDEDVNQTERPVIAVGGVDVKSAARPGHRTRREGAYPRLLALRAHPNCFCGIGSCLRCTG
eukprot:scaffold122056_cov54-Phaeocystis_antarctica.AAC.1